jgi:transmembrane sensor
MSPSWAYGPSAWIVQRAAKLAPEAICHRLSEEWLADLSALDGPMIQLRFALGCCRAALAMRGDRFDAAPAKQAARTIVQDLPLAQPRAGVKFPFSKRRDRIREGALTWLARLRRGLRDEEGSELREWLRPRSHRAYIARAAAQRDCPEDLAILSEFFQLKPDWVMPRLGRSPTVNVAATLMAICMAAVPLCYVHHTMPGLILGPALEGSFIEAQSDVYTSGRHTLRRIGLPDGTRVVMNRGTRIAVLYSDNIRSVLLLRGEATFTVPRQAHRSFDLTVADQLFGTEASTFNVRLTSKHSIELTVLEGTVTEPVPPQAVLNPEALRERNTRLPAPILLKARQMINSASGTQSPRTLSQLETQARIAWQRG